MDTVILDDDLKARLNGLNRHLELRDKNGNVVGHFVPDGEYKTYQRMMYDWAKAEFAREEAEEAARGIVRKWDGTNGRTTAEVLAGLQELEARIQRGDQGAAR